MSCDHLLIAEHVCDYMEGKLPPALHAACGAALEQCTVCRETHAQALVLAGLAGEWRQQAVPAWRRNRAALQPPGTQAFGWMNLGALAASLCAVALVLLQVEISTADGLWISIGGSQTEARVQELLAAELARYQQTSDILLEARLDDYSSQQLVANQLLLAQWREATRAERRDELSFLMSGWQNQRFADHQVLNEQFNRLASGQRETSEYLNALLQTVAIPGRDTL